MLDGLYVDNILTSFDDLSDLLTYFHTSRSLLQSAGFNLRSWRSFHMSPNDLAKSYGVLDPTHHPKVLGMVRDPIEDVLTYSSSKPSFDRKYTKRSVSSSIAKNYDSLGTLCPVLIRSKLFIQNLWKAGHD